MHAEWTLKALEAGKHVLCEKPFAANRAEAERVADAADAAFERSGLVVMEAFHYRHHSLAERMRAIVAGGELGKLRHVEAEVCFPLPRLSDIRYDYALAGGATMDAGCYAVHVARLLGNGDPAVISARMLTLRKDPRIDRAMSAELEFPDGVTGRVRASMWVASCAVDPGSGGRLGRRAERDQLSDAPALPPVDDPCATRRGRAHGAA
ncbi:Gfo/Idh/MocA family protein [Streptomyces sp. NPDC004532]